MELSVNDSSVTSIGIMVLAGKDGIIQLTGLKALCRGVIGGSRDAWMAVLTRQCAAGPYWWSMGTPAHAPPQGLTCALRS